MGKNQRKKSKSIFRKKLTLAIIFIFIIFLAGSTTFNILNTLRPVAVSVSTEEVLTTMILNNPIKSGLDKEIQRIQKEQLIKEVKAIREAEERRKKAEEEARRIEEAKKAKKHKKDERDERDKKADEEKIGESERIAYLTFDDGPSVNVTPRVLDILKEYDIKATFFILGQMANTNEEMIKRIANEGHAIGHHSYSHNYNFIYKNPENFITELDRTNMVLKRILGEKFETRLLRFPGGSFEKSKQKFVKRVEELGYKSYDWNALNGDAEGHNLPKDKLVNRLKETVHAKKHSDEVIILMHDTDAKATTADALPEIIEYLMEEGYEFKTLNQK